MTPRPPAFVTAAASSGPAATFILDEFVRRYADLVERKYLPSKYHRMPNSKELGDWCSNGGHSEWAVIGNTKFIYICAAMS